MGLFGAKRESKIAAVAESLTAGSLWHEPAVDAGASAVEDGHLRAGLALLRECRYDYERRAHRVGELSEAAIGHSGEIHDLMTDGMAAEDAADILLWLGATLISEAWEIRGSGTADTVGRDRFKLFFASLGTAEEPLLESARLRPDDPVPWTQMLTYGMGMQLDRAAEDAIWNHVAQRHRALYPANWVRLQSLCQKWGGSHAEMFAFARETVAAVPAGHPATAMLPLAHFEYIDTVFDDLVLDQEKRFKFVRFEVDHWSAEILTELKAAAEKWCSAAPGPHPEDLEAHHLFGWAFYRAEDKQVTDLARWHLGQVGRLHVDRPWGCTGDSEFEFAQALVELKLA